ncbi:hypothetical protein CBF31_08255 [Vagococcus fessus]|uniref:serine-type D-Ala-D-Ala carboxypeptidase n=2 Tax=Vagococcus fessus TaxID=120370 RepID=A0A430A9E5_9ENTE|nr:hypothetical protein CBF31_08255 [Vagococcus fessus]
MALFLLSGRIFMNLKKLKNKLVVSLTLIFTLGQLIALPKALADETDFSINSNAALAIDYNSGKILYEQNADKPLGIASMTKLITLYLILEAEQNGDLDWNEQVEISDHLLAISHDPILSNVPFIKGHTYSVRDLFNASTVVSANAAVTALAEKVAGSEKEFVDLMRKKVKKWGIEDAYIISTSGINNDNANGRVYPGSKPGEENLASAKDIAIIARHLIHDFPDFLNTTKEGVITFAEGTPETVDMTSTNLMLPGFPVYREGVDGLKTGTTDLAGQCFVGTYKNKNTRIITVVMNSTNSVDPNSRFIETNRLIDYVFENWKYDTIYKKGDVLTGIDVPSIKHAKELSTPVTVTKDIKLWLNKETKVNDLKLSYEAPETEPQAPLKKGEKVGQVSIDANEDTKDYVSANGSDHRFDLVTAKEVEKAAWYTIAGRSISSFFSNLF